MSAYRSLDLLWKTTVIDSICQNGIILDMVKKSFSKHILLPGLKRSLFLKGPHTFSCHGQFCQIHKFCLSVVVGKFKDTIPFPLHSTDHSVGSILFDFTSDSRTQQLRLEENNTLAIQ